MRSLLPKADRSQQSSVAAHANIQGLKAKLTQGLALLILTIAVPVVPVMLPEGSRFGSAVAQTRLEEGFEPIEIRGNLDAGDRTLDDGSYHDIYTFEGQVGLTLTIEMQSAEFDTYLILLDADSNTVAYNDDSDGANSRITVTLPEDGMYAVVANSYSAGETGSYRLTVREGDAGTSSPRNGTPTPETGTPDLPATGEAIADLDQPLANGFETIRVTGELGTGDRTLEDGSFYDLYSFSAEAGLPIVIELDSVTFDTYLVVIDSNSNPLAFNDDIDGTTNSRLSIIIPADGTYSILANSYAAGETGRYELTMYEGSAASAPPNRNGETNGETGDLAQATALMRQAEQLEAQGQYSAAIPLVQQALAIREAELGDDHPLVAESLGKLGSLYDDVGNYAAAEPLQLRALAIREAALGAEHGLVAESLNNLAVLYVHQGRYAEAIPLYERAIAIITTLEGADHWAVGVSLNNLAEVYLEQGRYAEATEAFRRSLAILEPTLGEDHPNVASSYNNLAEAYRLQGNYAEAEPLFRRSLALRQRILGENHPDVADSYNNLAALYAGQGNYDEAEELYQRAIAIETAAFGENHPDVAQSLNNLAEVYRLQGNYSAAEPLYQQALAIKESLFGAQHPTVATTQGNLANLYLAQGNYATAIDLYEEASTTLERALGRNHPDVATLLNNQGAAYAGQGNTATAETFYRQALDILRATVGDTHPRVADSLVNLGSSNWSRGDRAAALTALGTAADIQETNLELTLALGSEARRRDYINTLTFHTNMLLSLHLQAEPDNAEAAALALTTVLRRKGRVLDATADSFRTLRQQLSAADQTLLDELQAIETQRATLAFASTQDATRFATLERRAEELRNQLAQRSAAFRTETTPVTLAAIQQQLPADAALVELIRYDPYNPQQEVFGASRYAAYVLFREGAPRWVDLGEAEAIDAQVFAFRDALSNPNSDIGAIARTLDTQLMQPIRALTGDATHLLIAPDSTLNLIPFAALMDETNTYLAERYTFTYLTSGRDLLRMQASDEFGQRPVLVANPDYDQASSAGSRTTSAQRSSDFGNLSAFAPLPGTQEELEAIAPLLPNALRLEGHDATEAALRQVENPSILHIATHGFFLQDQDCIAPAAGQRRDAYVTITSTASTEDDCTPTLRNVENPLLRSGLVFAGVNQRAQRDSGDDGVLTAQEVSQMTLDRTQLVVLSACETGLGNVVNGDGVYGLRRAFVLAGADSQLMSLWQVDDFGTSQLMRGYYERMTSGMGRSEALRDVQQELLNTGAYGHPYYWAGFIFSGNWQPMEGI